ncbi:MAG: Rib/alpha-like domain-containing protein, partial [Haemophilus parainfluenzae]|nr:Rib/alpha-like domain-containing protein [Haemophilus parainfluenzae]
TNLDKLPKGTTVKDVTPEGTIDTNTPGDYTGKVEVTYPDGSKETVDVPVTVTDTTPAEKTEAPTVKKPKAGDKAIKGTAPKGSDVTVTLPDGTEIKTKADDQGNWTATVPAGKNLTKDDKIKVVAKDGDKTPSDEVTQTVAPWSSLFTAEGGELVVSKGKDVNAHDVYKKVKLIFKENNGEFVVGEDNRILLPIGNDSHAWLYVDPAKLPTKDSKVGQYTQNVTITYPDGSKQIVKVVVKVVDKTDAEKNPVVAPEKTEVKDKTALTDAEKKEVEGKVKDKNPKAEKVEVGNDGSVTLTYPDKSTNTLTPEQTVTEKAKTDAEKNPVVAPEKTEVKDKTALT